MMYHLYYEIEVASLPAVKLEDGTEFPGGNKLKSRQRDRNPYDTAVAVHPVTRLRSRCGYCP